MYMSNCCHRYCIQVQQFSMYYRIYTQCSINYSLSLNETHCYIFFYFFLYSYRLVSNIFVVSSKWLGTLFLWCNRLWVQVPSSHFTSSSDSCLKWMPCVIYHILSSEFRRLFSLNPFYRKLRHIFLECVERRFGSQWQCQIILFLWCSVLEWSSSKIV